MNEPQAIFCSRCGASLYGRSARSHRRRRVTAAGVVMSIALLLMLAATVFGLYSIVRFALEPGQEPDPYAGLSATKATVVGSATTESEGGSDRPSTTTTEAATLVRPTSVTSSSTLKATSSNNYRATNLTDGDLTTAWNEGAEGPGLGEWVLFEFSRQLDLSRIEVANGYQKDDDRYYGNPRVKSLGVEYSNGTTQLIRLLDTQDYQSIMPTRQAVEWVKFTIISVYPGEAWEDTALSEVRIYARSD